MSMLVDTGVLLRAFDANYDHFRGIRRALRKALDEKVGLYVTPQNMAEFWNVATRPLAYNGQGLSAERTKRRLGVIEQFCEVVVEDLRSYAEWKQLVDELGVSALREAVRRLTSA